MDTFNFSERVKRMLSLEDFNCTVRWDVEAIDDPLASWDQQQAIEVDCADEETALAVFDNRLNVSHRVLTLGARRINLKVQGELFLPMSPHLLVTFGKGAL